MKTVVIADVASVVSLQLGQVVDQRCFRNAELRQQISFLPTRIGRHTQSVKEAYSPTTYAN